jgi:ribosomal protein L21E
MPEYKSGDRVEVDISAGILPGTRPEPDWQRGTVVERLPDGMLRIRLEEPIAGQTAEKDALPEHVRPLT